MKHSHRFQKSCFTTFLTVFLLILTELGTTSAHAADWSATGSLATARSPHTATLLPCGKVLVAGGGNYLSQKII